MYDGDEKKDQDRAIWFHASQVGCVCDGVTSSPFSSESAELVSHYSPILFSNEIGERMQVLCDLLMVMRNEKLSTNVNLQPEASKEMQIMLKKVVQEKIRYSHQTTVVATKLVRTDQCTLLKVIRCGDSMFFAFSPDGDLLSCSPFDDVVRECEQQEARKGGVFLHKIDFAPGDEILAKFICTASKCPQVAAKAGIKTSCLNKWIICAPLDKCHRNNINKTLQGKRNLCLESSDRLVVPIYLCGAAIKTGSRRYIHFPYSDFIRVIDSRPRNNGFKNGGTVTAVLPDHFYTGDWTYFEDRFPLDANFVLTSDGFHNCFKNPKELWFWLNKHRKDLQDLTRQKQLLESLHQNLHKEHSDDDISFVWVYPKQIDKRFSEAEEIDYQGEISSGV